MVVGRKIIKFYSFDGVFKYKLSLNEALYKRKEEAQIYLPSEIESKPKKRTKKKSNLKQQSEPTKADLFIELIS